MQTLEPESVELVAGVMLTQISAYTTHKNLLVCKIMEAMHTAYAEKWSVSVSTYKESVHRLQTTFYFAESFDEHGGKGAFEIHHSFPYFFLFLFVGMNFRICVLVHLHMVCAPPQKLAGPL